MQVASGMAYLHSRQPAPGILHGDLKTSNLLLEDDPQRAVISDFGLSGWLDTRRIKAAEQLGALTATIAPPEVNKLYGTTVARQSSFGSLDVLIASLACRNASHPCRPLATLNQVAVPMQVLRDPHARRTAAADVYAFGIVLFEIMQVGMVKSAHQPQHCTSVS
jgi:serine/threonine protein kinase